LVTVNGGDIAYASGTGWTFDGATVSLVGPGPFVLSTGGVSFTSNVAGIGRVTARAAVRWQMNQSRQLLSGVYKCKRRLWYNKLQKEVP
jgi:hypothetical protein